MFRIIQECSLFIKNNHNFLISVLVSNAFPVFHKTGLISPPPPPVFIFSLFLDAQMSKENTTEECALLDWAESTHSSQMYVAF